MQPVARSAATARLRAAQESREVTGEEWERLAGTVTDTREPQELFGDETLEQALRQLAVYGRPGLPVVSADRDHLQGWLTRQNVLEALSQTVRSSEDAIEEGAIAAAFGADDPALAAHRPSTPLAGYEIVELATAPGPAAVGRRVDEIAWPPGCLVVAITAEREFVPPGGDTVLSAGESVILLAPAGSAPAHQQEPISVLPG